MLGQTQQGKKMDWQDSKMEKWLQEKCMTTNEFTKKVGCTRMVIWKVKRGLGISQRFADKIVKLTKGEVVPSISRVGGS